MELPDNEATMPLLDIRDKQKKSHSQKLVPFLELLVIEVS